MAGNCLKQTWPRGENWLRAGIGWPVACRAAGLFTSDAGPMFQLDFRPFNDSNSINLQDRLGSGQLEKLMGVSMANRRIAFSESRLQPGIRSARHRAE